MILFFISFVLEKNAVFYDVGLYINDFEHYYTEMKQ